MIHKPQFSLKQSQNNIIILFLYYCKLSYVRFVELYVLFKCFFVIVNLCFVLSLWRKNISKMKYGAWGVCSSDNHHHVYPCIDVAQIFQ